MMSDERKQELKDKIVEKLNERYELAAEECRKVQQEYLEQLESVARNQVDRSRHGKDEGTALMTIREVLEMEQQDRT